MSSFLGLVRTCKVNKKQAKTPQHQHHGDTVDGRNPANRLLICSQQKNEPQFWVSLRFAEGIFVCRSNFSETQSNPGNLKISAKNTQKRIGYHSDTQTAPKKMVVPSNFSEKKGVQILYIFFCDLSSYQLY